MTPRGPVREAMRGMLAWPEVPLPVPPPPGFEEIQRQELAALFGRMVGLRLFFVPAAAALLLYVALFEPSRWRTALVAALLLPMATFFVAELVRFRRAGFRRSATFWNLAAGVAAQLVLAFATGGLESPFTYAFVPLAIMTGVFAPWREHALLVGAQVAGVWALAAVSLLRLVPDLEPALFGGGPRAGHPDALLLATATVLSVILAIGSRAGRAVRGVFDRMLAQGVRAREDALRAHAERAEELTALSAEIAHELKNPLASVKGLASLVADGLPEGKTAERLGVLRREVDRMAVILDEFLNFSRPLVPLALSSLDVPALARETAALCEGLARERGVAVEVRGGAAGARCDARKVKQILVNLLQNALEASAAGSAVELEIDALGPAPSGGGPCVRVRMRDRGHGLDPAVAGRAFDPGVTSKPRGSGLGLTIARALARQHGGELLLHEREGGGCEAELELPVEPPGAAIGDVACSPPAAGLARSGPRPGAPVAQ